MSQLELFSNSELDTISQLPSSLPGYRVRESNRAKHVSIKISVEGDVEVVVPPRFDRAQLPSILEKRRDWILKTRARLLSDRPQATDDWHLKKPDTILLRWRSKNTAAPDTQASGKRTARGFQVADPKLERWSVRYQPNASGQTLCVPSGGNQLTIRGDTDHLPACQAVLRQWLAHRAQRELAPWLRQLGFDLDLPCHRISVRGQKTRWASCSSHKDISLNYKLLFLPRPLVHYVLVHELCPTVHMNHSKAFWTLVGEKQPDYTWRRDQLKKAWRYIPRWVET